MPTRTCLMQHSSSLFWSHWLKHDKQIEQVQRLLACVFSCVMDMPTSQTCMQMQSMAAVIMITTLPTCKHDACSSNRCLLLQGLWTQVVEQKFGKLLLKRMQAPHFSSPCFILLLHPVANIASQRGGGLPAALGLGFTCLHVASTDCTHCC